MDMIQVGKQVRYKVHKGRARPAVGTIVRRAGVFVEIENKWTKATVRISPKMIVAEHEFKPYTKRA